VSARTGGGTASHGQHQQVIGGGGGGGVRFPNARSCNTSSTNTHQPGWPLPWRAGFCRCRVARRAAHRCGGVGQQQTGACVQTEAAAVAASSPVVSASGDKVPSLPAASHWPSGHTRATRTGVSVAAQWCPGWIASRPPGHPHHPSPHWVPAQQPCGVCGQQGQAQASSGCLQCHTMAP
jgi:hypothetical protein